jgi:hypothetical protein
VLVFLDRILITAILWSCIIHIPLCIQLNYVILYIFIIVNHILQSFSMMDSPSVSGCHPTHK